MKRLQVAVVLLFVAMVGCGGSPKSAPASGGHGEPGHEHPELSAELTHFHDVMAPLWHAEGPDRLGNACRSPDLLPAGEALQVAAAPAGVAPDVWQAEGNLLVSDIAAFRSACANLSAESPPAVTSEVEKLFAAVHQDFHTMVEATGGEDEHAPGRADEHATDDTPAEPSH